MKYTSTITDRKKLQVKVVYPSCLCQNARFELVRFIQVTNPVATAVKENKQSNRVIRQNIGFIFIAVKQSQTIIVLVVGYAIKCTAAQLPVGYNFELILMRDKITKKYLLNIIY
jgi:hypothetical protein